LIALSISAAAILITFFLYYRKPAQLALRIAAITLIYLLITNFTLRIKRESPPDNPVVVIDHSMSMKNRITQILKTVTSVDVLNEIYFAQESLLTKQQPAQMGGYTDLSGTIKRAGKLKPAPMILISDGNHNFGISPVSNTEEFDFSIYTYGVGEEMLRDVAINDVSYPNYSYAGDSVQIEAIIETGGFQAGTCDIALQSATGNDIAVQSLPLSSVTAENNLTFSHLVVEPGTLQLKISANPQANETSYDNNEYTFYLNVLEEKIAVLYYTDHISFTTKFLMQSLKENPNISISAIARFGSNDYRSIPSGNKLAVLPDLHDYDVLIFDSVNLERLPWHNIPESVASRKGIILMGTLDGINTSWREIMPISTAIGVLQGTYRVDVIEPFSVLTPENNPPVKNINRAVTAKEDAVIIARTGNLPIIGYRVQERGKVFQICIVDIGPWSFLRSGVKGEGFLQNLLGDVVRFLSPLGQHERLVLSTKDRDHILGATVNLELQSYDRNLQRVGGGDFFLVLEDDKIPFYETRMGQYEARFLARDTGRISVQAQGELSGEHLTSDILQINISSRSIENERRLNRALLQRIAAASNGEFHTLDELEDFVMPDISPRKAIQLISLDSPISYFLVLGLLILDWIIRRRRGVT
jgi:hypothetical protein